MNLATKFVRLFFVSLSILFMMVSLPSNGMLGLILGLGLGGLLIVFDIGLKKISLRTFNVTVLGLFFGFLMGKALTLIFQSIVVTVPLSATALEVIKSCLFLFGIYLGTILTLRSSDELYLSIPFVKFSSLSQKKKDLILDASTLMDARIIDLAATGLLDNHLLIPRFIVKDLLGQTEALDEISKAKAKRATEVLKKLQMHPELDLRIYDHDYPEITDPTVKLIRMARAIDANILTADISRVQMPPVEGVRIINIHALSNALKPLMQTGEEIKIKVQRYGKEPRQGVGYLEDGTMVVVNGGGSFIGEIIDAQVLSVKHTTSGRMIFCNAKDEQAPAHFGAEYE